MSSSGVLTPTSYAILGLLAIRPWTTYELAKQMDRTLNRFWPRARSKLYEEPKKLVAQGLAEADTRRPRSAAADGRTPSPRRGRQALAAWLATESARAGLRVRAPPQGVLRRERLAPTTSWRRSTSSAPGRTS